MTIRAASIGDAAAVAELAAATFALACPASTDPADIARHIASELTTERFARDAADPGRILLVDDPGQGVPLTGYVLVLLAEPTDPDVVAATRIRPTAELSKCYVREGAHGSGVAGALMTAALDAAAAHGAAGVWLGTHNGNARAIRFYGKHGFAPVGTKRFRLGDRFEDDVVLERALDPAPVGAGPR